MPPADEVVVRHADVDDAEAIAEILNHYILHSTATFMTEPVTAADRRIWIRNRHPEHPLRVAERGGVVLGWAALHHHSPRTGFEGSAEDSIYLRPEQRGQGIGLKLLNRLIQDASEHGFHSLVAGVCAEQAPSIRLHERAGYVRVAHYREIAQKYQRWLDVVYLQRMLTPPIY